MSEKEPGQMAYEAFCSREGMACAPWSSLFPGSKELWAAVESAIRADEAAKVRAATIEEATKVAEAYGLTEDKAIKTLKFPQFTNEYRHRENAAYEVAAAIRALGEKHNG